MQTAEQFVILADESAAWRIAGLTQLDRLALELNQLAESSEATVEAIVCWRPEISAAAKSLPRHPNLKRVRLTESLKSVHTGARIVSTRIFLSRGSLPDFLRVTQPIQTAGTTIEGSLSWDELSHRFELSRAATCSTASNWQYLKDATNLGMCENKILSAGGKAQDGLVSRYINRPISRSITRALLRHNIAPRTWTASIFALPLVAFLFLLRGNYIGVVAGAAIFQVYSILDGCDGEIARATYSESERGAFIDDLLDTSSSILYVIGLGMGLSRMRGATYGAEGLLCAAIIAVKECLVSNSKRHAKLSSNGLNKAFYPKYHDLIHHSGLLLLGRRFVCILFQLTKRDVAILAFFFLALANLSPWILHLWTIVAAGSLILAGIARHRLSGQRSDVSSPEFRS